MPQVILLGKICLNKCVTYKWKELIVLTPLWRVMLYVLPQRSCRNNSNALAGKSKYKKEEIQVYIATSQHEYPW